MNPRMSDTRVHHCNCFAIGKKLSQREIILDHTESPQKITAQRGEAILEGVGPSAWKTGLAGEGIKNGSQGHDSQPYPLRQFSQGPAWSMHSST